MTHTRTSDAPPLRLELANEWAWCGQRRVVLAPKTFAVLRHLVEHAGRLVTKDELMSAVWGDTIVSEASLTSCIRDLRKALPDSSRAPRYIETVHRRGFRFVGPLAAAPVALAEMPARDAVPPPPTLVGRNDELACLRDLLRAALGGGRRVVFVTGEGGIGKTALLEAFLAQIGDRQALRVGRGQCVEQYGAGEPYLPVLEALGRLGREADGGQVVRILKQHAPSWLAQLPALLDDRDLEAVQRRAQGTTRERMLRELADALDALSAETPLVLLLEDLHWGDSATVDLLALLARRRDPARLLLLGTYRPAEVAEPGHPLRPVKQELHAHGQCTELALDFLPPPAVDEYLQRRFPGASFAAGLGPLLHASTGGNPLFLVNVVDDMIARGQLREEDASWQLTVPVAAVGSALPDTLAQMVEKQIERLTPAEQTMLAIGSVAGAEFSAALSVVDGIEQRDGERLCDGLARRGQLLRALGAAEWPDGTIAGRFGFIHALYRNALYARVPIGHRVGLHLRIGSHLERAHGPRASEIAGELAMHFEQGRDFERAVLHHGQAADGALRRHAYAETANHATRALELLGALPASVERDGGEILLQTLLGAVTVARSGWNAPEVARSYGRARELCDRLGAAPQLFAVLLGLCGFYLTRGEVEPAREMAGQLLVMAETMDDAAVAIGAHNSAGMTAFYSGAFTTAIEHCTQAWRLYDPEKHSPNRLRAFSVDHDPGVSCAAHGAWALSALGHPEQAAARMEACLVHARAIDHPVTLVMALNFAATFHQDRRDHRRVAEIEDERLALATEYGLDLFLRLGEIYRGWLDCAEGDGTDGIARIRRGIEAYRAVGAALGVPTFLAILAEACRDAGRVDDGLAAVHEGLALAARTGLHCWDAALQRLRGTLVLRAARASRGRSGRAAAELEAEAAFLEALAIARRQEALSLELRAASALARLRLEQARNAEGSALLSGVLARFTEGRDTHDLVAARALLDELGGETPVPPVARRSPASSRGRAAPRR